MHGPPLALWWSPQSLHNNNNNDRDFKRPLKHWSILYFLFGFSAWFPERRSEVGSRNASAAKRHRKTAELSILERWGAGTGAPQSSVQSGADVNWRRVATSDTFSVCFPVDKRSVRGNPPPPFRRAAAELLWLADYDGLCAVLMSTCGLPPHHLLCFLFLQHCTSQILISVEIKA